MERQLYQCCFCGREVISNELDITSLIVIANWEKEDSLQREQQLYCHIDCLRKRLSKKISLYFTNEE